MVLSNFWIIIFYVVTLHWFLCYLSLCIAEDEETRQMLMEVMDEGQLEEVSEQANMMFVLRTYSFW